MNRINLEMRIGQLEDWRDKLKYCDECGGLFHVADVQEVEFSLYDVQNYTNHYCKAHRLPYDKYIDGKLFKDNVEVTKTGKIKK